MTTLADLRQKYPVFKDKGDFDIVKMLSEEMQQPLDYTAYQLGLPPGDYVQNTGFGGDTATDLAVGASQIPGTIAGLADLANPFAYIPETNNLTLSKGVDWAEQQMGLTDWRNRQQAMLSPERQAQDQAIRDKFAEGDVAGGAWEAVTSPRSFAGAAIQSVPLSLLGGALGRGVGAAADVAKLARLKKVAPWVGEGAVSTGAQVDQLTQQGVDPGTANLAGLAAGAGVGALGGSLGMAGRAVGIDDVEAWLGGAGRLAEGTKPVSLIPRIGGSAALETLQEMPQSAWEQVTQNVATGDPLGKDVAYQTIMGGLSGAAMGGAFGVMPRGYKPETPPPPASEDTQAPPPPPPPAPDLNQAAPPAPTPPASKPAAPGVSPDQLSEFERGLLGSLGSHPGNPDFTALNPDGTVKGWVVDALHQASTNTPEQLKRKINSKSGIILKPLWEAALAEKQKLKAAPPTPTTNAPEYSDNEKALIGLVSPEQYRKSDHKLNGLAEKAVRKIASLSLDDLRDAQGKKIPTWHIPLYEHMIAVREAEQKQANPESPAGQTSQEADLKTSQNPTQEAAPTPPVVATQEPTPTPIEVPDAQAVPPTPQASQTPSRPEVPAPAAPTDLRPSPDAAQQAEMEARRARFEQRKREAQAAADAQAATLETLATRKVVVDDSAPGWQDRLNAAIDKVATERGFDAKTRATFSEMVQRFYQVGRFNTYSGISEPPSYDAMAGRMTRDGHPVSHTTMGLLLNEFQKNYVEGLSADNITPTFENTKAEAVGMPHDSGNYRGKKNTGATSAAEDYVDLSANRSENVATVAKDINDLGPERLDVSMPLNPNSGMDATAEDTVDAKYAQDSIETDNPDADLGYTTGAIGNAETAAQGGSGGGNVSSRPKVTAYFKSRYRFAANAERAKAGQAPITEQEITKELGKLDDIVLGRYFDRVVRSGVSDKRMVDPKDPKPKLLDAYQALQDDIKALGENAFRNTKNNRTVNDLPDPDTSIAVPGAISAWDKAVVGMPGAVHIGTLPAELAGKWESVYNQTLHLPDIHRAPALKKFARSLIDEYHARGSVRTSGQDTRPTSQPQGSEQVGSGSSQDNAERLAESGNAQPGLAEERGQAASPEVVVGDKSLAGVQVKARPKRRIAAPPALSRRAASQGMTTAAVKSALSGVVGKLATAIRINTHVVQTVDELQKLLPNQDVPDNTRGMFYAGKVYLVADNLPTIKAAKAALAHEVVGHLGIEKILGEEGFDDLVARVGRLKNSSPEVKKTLDQLKEDYTDAYGEYNLDQVTEAKEVLAHLAESKPNFGLVRELLAKLRLWLAKHGLGDLDAATLESLLVQSARETSQQKEAVIKGAEPDYGSPLLSRKNIPAHLSGIQSAVSDKIKDTYSHTTKRGILGWMSIGQIADRFGKDLPMVKVISKTMDEMSAQSKHWLDKADHTVRMWGLLTPKQKELLHKIMAQATLNEYDPEMSNSIPTKPVEKQIDQMWTQLKALDVNAKVKAVNVYRAARQCFRDDLAEADAFLAKLQSKATGKQATSLNHLIAAIKTLSKNRKGVYFPLLRVGDFYSVGMSPKLFALHEKKLAAEDGGQALNPGEQVLYDKMRLDKKQYMVEGHKSEAQAAKAVARYESQGMVAASNVKRFVSSKARAAITPEMERFQKILSDLDVPDSIAGSLEQAYEHLLINNLPEGHALKQQLHREGIYGWHEDMMQSFAKAAQSRAFALSRLLHVRDLQEQMGELDAYSAFGRNPPEKAQMARDVLNELKRQQDLAYTRTSDPVLVRFATGWNYYAMLGASPAFWLLNLSQVPVITLPWLAARNKNQYGTTIKALAKGAKQVYQMISVGFENGELRSELDPTRNVPGISAEEKQLLTGLKDRGKLEFTIGMDTGAIGEGEYGAISKLKRSLNTPTNVTELINRGSTALAAYRISRANHHTHEQAVEFAVEAIDKTHMNYDPATTARNLKTIMGIPGTQAFAKIAFQFWKFQQGMAYLTLSTMKDAFNSPDPVVRKQARDTAIGMTITLTTTAGAFGLPFVGWGLGLLTQLFKAGPDDRDPDAERMLKNWIHDYLPWAEDYLTKGLWGLLPQGANPDFSNRFSTANLMNPLAYARYDNTARGEDVVKETLFRTFGGATATNAGAVYDGIKAMLDGDMLKATEKLVPLKFLRDLAKAAELQTKGLQTGTGEQRLNPGDFTAMDEIWQLMGVTPMKKSLYYDRTKAVNDAMQAVNDVRTKLMSEYGQARMHGGDVSKIMQEVTKFNIRNPQAKITMENLKQAYQRRQKNQQNTDEFGVLLDKRTKPYASNARWAS